MAEKEPSKTTQRVGAAKNLVKGAAGGTAASRVVGGGVQGVTVEAARMAANTKAGRLAIGGLCLVLVLILAIPIGTALFVGGVAQVGDGQDQQNRSYDAAIDSGVGGDDGATYLNAAVSQANSAGVDWQVPVALGMWQSGHRGQEYCPPVDPEAPDPGEIEDPGEGTVQEVDGWAHPVTGDTYRVLSAYGTRIETGQGMVVTTALTFAGAKGTPVVAAGAGTVVYAGWNDTGGRMVWIDLAGTETPTQLRYMHLEEIQVSNGVTLEAGDPVGAMGDTGQASRVQLAFEVLENDEHTDPAPWLESHGLVVNHGLPVGAGFSDPCAGGGGPIQGGPGEPGDGSYPGTEGFPGPPAWECPPSNFPEKEQGIKESTLRGLRCSMVAFPDLVVTSTLGSRPPGYPSRHPMGLAVDYAISPYQPGPGTPGAPNYSPAAGMVYMYAMAHWTQINADNLGIETIIYGDMVWRNDGQGWRPYTYPGGGLNDSTRHLDHVHVSYYEEGGLPDAGHLKPALADGSGMAWTEQNLPGRWRFVPIDDPSLDLDSFPRDGGDGLRIGDNPPGGVSGDYRSIYRIERAAFGPLDELDEADHMARMGEDPDYAHLWNARVEAGRASYDFEDADELASRAGSDEEFATGWVSGELAWILNEQDGMVDANIAAGQVYDGDTETVTFDDSAAGTAAARAYTNAVAELPVAGMNPTGAGQVFGMARQLLAGEMITSGRAGGVPGVICTPAGDATLVVASSTNPSNTVVMDSRRLGYAATAVHVAKESDINQNGQLAMLMTILQESSFLMYASQRVPESLDFPHDAVGSDHDSAGLYQQRGPDLNWAWGPIDSIMDVSRSTGAFLGVSQESRAPGMVQVPGWQTMPPGELAQAIQVSAHPHLYAQWQEAAAQILGEVEGIPCSS